MPVVTHHEARLSGARLHYVAAGPADGPLVVLLHGFPELWYSWRYQIPALAAAGFRVVAPDQRGYSTSSKPSGIESYTVHRLAGDVEELIAHLGAASGSAGGPGAIVVGHDWGGVVAWMFAATRPQLTRKLVTVNSPHPAAYRREIRGLPQLLRAWYVFFFQIPIVPEALFGAGDGALVEQLLRIGVGRREVLDETDFGVYREALRQPGALHAMFDWYRAAARALAKDGAETRPGPVRAPTLVIWGERDPALSLRLLDGLERWVPGVRIERIPKVGHFPHQQAHERVNEALLGFLRG
jgi:pimeloyl-ACP methyl ester carboxylesterase